ncbi:MAG: sporulation protein YqfD [Firmicutes bacterium]|nr:sporulation protein YqfD [Bacillota bacterium]
MISQRLSAFFQGYLVAMVKGTRCEELLNRGVAGGVILWDIDKKAPGTILFKMHAHQYAKLRPFFFRTGTKGKILRKKGWPFLWRRVWRKKGWLLGMALFLGLLLALSSFIWFVEITGVEKLDKALIRQHLAVLGLAPGVSRRTIAPQRDWLIRELRIRLPEVVWITIRIQGVVAEVVVAEKRLPPPVDEGPGNLVAAKDGLITEILLIEGTPLVRVGDTVSLGDPLILGETTRVHLDGSIETKKVKAAGEVRARVWYEIEVDEPLAILEPRVVGGEQKIVYRLRLGSWLLPLFSRGAGDVGGFVRQDRAVKTIIPGRNSLSLVEIIKDAYQRVEWTTVQVSPEAALLKARKKAEARIQVVLPAGVQPERTQESWRLQAGVLNYRLIIETKENIAVPD